MSAFDHFTDLVRQLGQHWGVGVDFPVRGCTTRFGSENEGEIMLRLSDDESALTVGASLPLSSLCEAPIDRHALQLFLLQRAHMARLGSQIRYAWLREDDRIALYRDIETSDATLENILATLDDLNARFDALVKVVPLFHQAGQIDPTPDSMHFQAFV